MLFNKIIGIVFAAVVVFFLFQFCKGCCHCCLTHPSNFDFVWLLFHQSWILKKKKKKCHLELGDHPPYLILFHYCFIRAEYWKKWHLEPVNHSPYLYIWIFEYWKRRRRNVTLNWSIMPHIWSWAAAKYFRCVARNRACVGNAFQWQKAKRTKYWYLLVSF